jgi:hypothetical protein
MKWAIMFNRFVEWSHDGGQHGRHSSMLSAPLRPIRKSVAVSGATSFNRLSVEDTQPQNAASRRWLRAGQRQR